MDYVIDNAPVRKACKSTIEGLLFQIPYVILGSTEKTSASNLRWMLNHCLTQIDTFPIDKMNRWIGFVQGVLAMSGHLDVDKERDRTREFFRQAYQEYGQKIPKTAEMTEDWRRYQGIDELHQDQESDTDATN